MSIVLTDDNTEFLKTFKNAVIGEYNESAIKEKNQQIDFKITGNSIFIKISIDSPAKLQGFSSTIDRLWNMSKKIYYEI